MRKKTHEEYVLEVAEKYSTIEVVGSYINKRTKILHRCKIDGHEWLSTPEYILKGYGCPKCKQSKETYYQKNKELRQKYQNEYYKKHRKERMEYQRKYNEEHMTDILKYQKKKYDKIKYRKRKRYENGNEYTDEQFKECLDFFNNVCAYSKEEFRDNSKDKMSADHIVPLSRGGSGFIWNIIPVKFLYNSSKGNRDMVVWYKQQEFFSEDQLQLIFDWQIYAYNKWGNLNEVI